MPPLWLAEPRRCCAMTNEQRIQAIRARAEAGWEETWLPIPGANGYEVSDFGNVRSFFMKGNHKTKRVDSPRTLSRHLGKTGYPSVSLPSGEQGHYATRQIHR